MNAEKKSTVTRIVRPHQIFMGKRAGEKVEVPSEDINTNATKLATMSVSEWKNAQGKRKASPKKEITSVERAAQLFEAARAGLEAIKAANKAALESKGAKF